MASRTGRPPRLSRAQIVSAAGELIAQEGVEALTMRRLATRLGATPMAVYHHVRDKEELMLLLLNEAAAGIRRPELPGEPRERVVVIALALHDTLARLPWVVQTLAADDLLSPAGLWFPEQIIDAAMTCGLGAEAAVYAYRSIWYYTAGEILIRAHAARRRVDDDRPTFRDRLFTTLEAPTPEISGYATAALEITELPRLGAVADRWAELTAVDTYEHGLRALVRGLLDPATASPS